MDDGGVAVSDAMDYKIAAHVTVEQMEKSVECLKRAIKSARANSQREYNARYMLLDSLSQLKSVTDTENNIFAQRFRLSLESLEVELESRCEHQRYIADRCTDLIEWIGCQIVERKVEKHLAH